MKKPLLFLAAAAIALIPAVWSVPQAYRYMPVNNTLPALCTPGDLFNLNNGAAGLYTCGPAANMWIATSLLATLPTALVAAIGPISTTETSVIEVTVPAASVVAGSTYRVAVAGTSTNTAGGKSSFNVRFGASGAITDTQIGVLGVTASGTGTNIPFLVEFLVTFRSTTQTMVTGFYNVNSTLGMAGQLAGVSTPELTSGLSTASAMILQLSFVTGSAAAASTFQQATINLVKP